MIFFISILSTLFFISLYFIWKDFKSSLFPNLSDFYILYSSFLILLTQFIISSQLVGSDYSDFIPEFTPQFIGFINNYFFIILILYIIFKLFFKKIRPKKIIIKDDFIRNIRFNKNLPIKFNFLQTKILFYSLLTFFIFTPLKVEGSITCIGVPLSVAGITSIFRNSKINFSKKILFSIPSCIFLIVCLIEYTSSKRYFIIPLAGSIILILNKFLNQTKSSRKISINKLFLSLKIFIISILVAFLTSLMQLLRGPLFLQGFIALFSNPLLTLKFFLTYSEAGNIGMYSLDFLDLAMKRLIIQNDIGTYGKILGFGFIPFTGEILRINDVYSQYIDPIGQKVDNTSYPVFNIVTFSSYNLIIGCILFIFTLLILDWMLPISMKIFKKFQIVGWVISFYSFFQFSRGSDLSLTLYTFFIACFIGFIISQFIEYET